MENYTNYLIFSSLSIPVFYMAYLLFFRKEQNLKTVRIFLLSSILFSLILPLNPVSISIPQIKYEKPILENTEHKSEQSIQTPENKVQITQLQVKHNINTKDSAAAIPYKSIVSITYWIVCSIFLARLILSMSKILYFYFTNEKVKQQNFTIIFLDKRIIAFSFFNWIFVDKLNTDNDLAQIIKHEKIHASQYHSIDLLISELLVATMWFNPFAWMFKKALQQVHEFLADEGVINSGYNKLEYQSLLVNQAAEERLVAVSSNFSYSLIKKRIMMMSKVKKNGGTGIKLLVLIPMVAALLFIMPSFKAPVEAKPLLNNKISIPDGSEHKSVIVENKIIVSEPIIEKTDLNTIAPKDTTPKNQEYIAAISPTKMNVLYIGVDNPVSIAVTGAKKGKITPSIDNGTISGENRDYIVRVREVGITTITVKVDNTIVLEQKFRIKRVPDPIGIIARNWNKYEFTKQDLLDAGGIEILMANFDFDLKFDVVEFTLTAYPLAGFMQTEKSNSSKFSKQQIELINSAKPGSKIYIEDIQAKGPDGTIRKLGALVLKII